MADYYFRTRDLKVGYHGRALLENIRIDLEKGEILTLVGPNGAGKSTILKSITRQLEILGGRVAVGGKKLTELTYQELSRKMAVVLTDRVRPELMTGHDIVAAGRYPYTGRLGILSREDERKVEEAMELVNAGGLGKCLFTSLSDGQKQRLLLARAICQEPEILVLDEPTSFLDIRYKLELLDILRRMAKRQGITVVMSLHEIDLAGKISDKVLPVKAGCIYDYGTPEEILRRILYGSFMAWTGEASILSLEALNCRAPAESRRRWSSPRAAGGFPSTGACRRRERRLSRGSCMKMI